MLDKPLLTKALFIGGDLYLWTPESYEHRDRAISGCERVLATDQRWSGVVFRVSGERFDMKIVPFVCLVCSTTFRVAFPDGMGEEVSAACCADHQANCSAVSP